ncbi:pseudouridine synthase [Pelagophyceae sp. CCMP2097]|nr:pseudouridine synthase [Pelagophyceae sp. CCMP2097]
MRGGPPKGKPAARNQARRKLRQFRDGATGRTKVEVEQQQIRERQRLRKEQEQQPRAAAPVTAANNGGEDFSEPLWPLHDEPPKRCQPASLDAVEPRVLLRTSRFVIIDKPPDVKHDGPNAVTVEKLAPGALWPHRLDYGTSGLMVGAVDKASLKALGNADFSVSYVAVVIGTVVPDDFVIDAAIGKLADGDIRMAVGPTAVKAKPARTRVEILERCSYDGLPVTKVRLTPQTSRRHQLRVHLRHVGHAIVGETTYDSSPLSHAPRLCLHAQRLVAALDDTKLTASTGDPFPVEDGVVRMLIEAPRPDSTAAESAAGSRR